MMNSARINTAVSGMSIAGTAYLNALEYTRNRIQGKDITGDATEDVPIMRHPDVRRMLMWMKASVDGMRSMIYTGAFWSDLAAELNDGDEKHHYQNLLGFITPIYKGKILQANSYADRTLPHTLAGIGTCLGQGREIAEMPEGAF